MSEPNWVFANNTAAARRKRWTRPARESKRLVALDAIAEDEATVLQELADDLATSAVLRQADKMLGVWD